MATSCPDRISTISGDAIQVEALIAGAYLAGTNTRRVKRALAALFRCAVGKDVTLLHGSAVTFPPHVRGYQKTRINHQK